MSFLSRFACFSGQQDWRGAGSSYDDYVGAAARSRVLGILEEEIDAQFSALPFPSQAAAQDAVPLRRLFNANLSGRELALAKELLRKLGALDAGRAAAEQEHRALLGTLKEVELAARHAEFARARAEALATARGEALMHAQQALREAEGQQAQLSEALKQALAQLGVELTPNHHQGGATGNRPLISPSGILVGDSTMALTPLPLAASLAASQQLKASLAQAAAAMAPVVPTTASLAQAPAAAAPPQQAVQPSGSGRESREEERRASRASHASRASQQEAAALAAQQQQQQQRASRAPSAASDRRQSQGSAPAAGRASQHSQEFSGFTVYSNELSPDFQAAGNRRQELLPAEEEEEERVGLGHSRVPWRDISTAASLSASMSGDEDWAAAGAVEQREQPAQRRSGSAQQMQHQPRARASQEAERDTAAEQQAVMDRRQAHAARLARLVLPHLDASQLDSLVRIGASASMQSGGNCHSAEAAAADPDALSPAALQELLPPVVWESGVQPDELLLHLQREAAAAGGYEPAPHQWQSAGGARAGAGGGRGSRAGSEPPAEEEFAYSPEVPGAGTWVSPTLSAQLHAKAKALGGASWDSGALPAEPSPPAHIKAVRQAVFKGDMGFYNALGAGAKELDASAGNSLAGSGARPLGSSQPQAADALRRSGTNPLRHSSAAGMGLPPMAAAPGVGGQQAPRASSAGARPLRASTERLPPLHAGAAGTRQSQDSLSRMFQPMGRGIGQGGVQSSAVAPHPGAAPRPDARLRRSADENALRTSTFRASQPLTKRSLDSINASINAAMEALAPPEQKQQQSGQPLAQPRHTRGASMPPALAETNWGRSMENQRASHPFY